MRCGTGMAPEARRCCSCGITRCCARRWRAGAARTLPSTSARGEILGVVGESGSRQVAAAAVAAGPRDARLRAPRAARASTASELVGAERTRAAARCGATASPCCSRIRCCRWNPYLTLGAQLVEVLQAASGSAIAARAAARAARRCRTSSCRSRERAAAAVSARTVRRHAPAGDAGAWRCWPGRSCCWPTSPPRRWMPPRSARARSAAAAARDAACRSCWSRTTWAWSRRVADRVLVLQQGRIVEQGGTAELLRARPAPMRATLLDAARQLERHGAGR